MKMLSLVGNDRIWVSSDYNPLLCEHDVPDLTWDAELQLDGQRMFVLPRGLSRDVLREDVLDAIAVAKIVRPS